MTKNNSKQEGPPPLDTTDEPKEHIKFKCKTCRQPLEAEVDMMGEEVDCPNCGKTVKVPFHVFSINPFKRPLRKFLSDLGSIQWTFPLFPQLIESAVILLVLAITVVLYLTVGIASQIAGIFQSLMLDARHQIKTGSLIEKSAYAVAAGVYVTFWLPFWIVLLPFSILGWFWKHLGYLGLIVLAVIVVFGAVLFLKPEILTLFGITKRSSEQPAGIYGEPAEEFTETQP